MNETIITVRELTFTADPLTVSVEPPCAVACINSYTCSLGIQPTLQYCLPHNAAYLTMLPTLKSCIAAYLAILQCCLLCNTAYFIMMPPMQICIPCKTAYLAMLPTAHLEIPPTLHAAYLAILVSPLTIAGQRTLRVALCVGPVALEGETVVTSLQTNHLEVTISSWQ